MSRSAILLVPGLLAAAAAAAVAIPPADRPSRPARFVDDFDRGLCIGDCPGAHWAIAQQESGRVAADPAPRRAGLALHARAEAKGTRVTKADVVARIQPVSTGSTLTVAFDLFVSAATPRNSLQLVDLECASCGEGGNPGIRLYLRRGRLRIDRSKIGIEHAWVRDDAPVLRPDRWHRIVFAARIDAGAAGGARVTLDGQEVLAERGATVMPLARRQVDRVQIGITANSNPVPAEAWFDNVGVFAGR